MSDILGERDDAVPDVTTRVAEPSRESQLPKRFYKNVEVQAEDGGFALLLDGKNVRTPGKALVAVPDAGLAETLRMEWDAQGERIDPLTMPLTRLVNTAVDGVANEMQAVKEDIVRYAGTDAICYRASGPEGLVERQNAAWDPLIDWATTSLNAPLSIGQGITYVAQPAPSIAQMSARVGQVDSPLLLTSLHLMTALTGSAIIALAVLDGELSGEEAWHAAHVDEDWNIEEWGADEEATARRAARWTDMQVAVNVAETLR
ncbi:MAG: ATP12 family protein [Pseudomonadota bacterium]